MKSALASVSAQKGEMIEVAVLPKGDYSFDTTTIELHLDEIDGKGREWDLVKEVVPDPLEFMAMLGRSARADADDGWTTTGVLDAAVVTPSADLDLAVRAIVFSAAGTAGQRCTTLRRLIVHRSEGLRAVPPSVPLRT